ncbi:MAG: HD domain-containing protein [Trueperaceae bacterium]
MPADRPGPGASAAIAEARRLANGLDPRLSYHDAFHTFYEVLPAARRLATAAGVNATTRRRLEVAACFHDLGFLRLPRPDGRTPRPSEVEADAEPLRDARGTGHEQASVELMRSTCAPLGFGGDALDEISGMILATRLPQRPRTLGERLMADADLALLGSGTFPNRNERLRLERAQLGERLSRPSWLRSQIRFLLRHRFTSTEGERLFGVVRRRNAAILRARLQRLVRLGTDRSPPGRSSLHRSPRQG